MRNAYGAQVGCSLAIVLALTMATTSSAVITPDTPGPGDVHFTVNSTQNVKAISPWIYGINGTSLNSSATGDRMGGNRWTAYNWETNASNAGADYYFESDNYLSSSSTPGAAILPTLQADGAAHRSLIVTVPMAGYVSGDEAGPVQLADVANLTRFKQVVAKKSSIYSGAQAALSLTPDKTDNYVFTDEYVNWVESHKVAGQQVFYDLDNEPGLWGESLPAGWTPGNPSTGTPPSSQGRTHGEVHPYAPTYAELKNDTIANAGAIKDVNPNAMVFGGVGYGWNDFTSLQGAPDQNTNKPAPHPGGTYQTGEMYFYDYLLQQVHAAEVSQGRKLMDVLDMHWYPEATGLNSSSQQQRITDVNSHQNDAGVAAARVQAPRSLWDPTYTETSWITQYSTLGPIKLLPRTQTDINDFDPGTKMAISEYNYGGGNNISGGVAEADALGVFGQQGLFAANLWPVDSNANSQFTSGGFKMFLNYNGAGGKFGDTSIGASVGASEIANSSVYASTDSTNPNRMIVMAINRTTSAKVAAISLTYDRVFDHAEVYQLTSASPNPVHVADISLDQLNAFDYSMPASSVTTLVLVADGLPGDYNRDGKVDMADYVVWRDAVGATGDVPADGNEDNIVDARDFDLWRTNFGRTEGSTSGFGTESVPEPSVALLTALSLCAVIARRKR
ncbi:MAG TPA: glycoside hydrolase family 44 protein [Lacipirellulaceae bacterium]|nr:glycoside hydrolase family 44 protein [Lacipirellulaceae bacterium]